MGIVDLTRTIRHRGPASRTQPIPMIFPSVTHEDTRPGFGGHFSIASMGVLISDHAGTHVDAWNHLSPSPDAQSIDQMDLSQFVATATAVDVSSYRPGEVVPARAVAERLDGVGEPVQAVLFRTGASPEPLEDGPAYHVDFPGLDRDTIAELRRRGVRLVGTDARSIDTAASERGGPDCLPAHRACLEHAVVVVENLHLPPSLCGTVFEFMALPLKLAGATGSPVRAIARTR